jgi:hypothetical protein
MFYGSTSGEINTYKKQVERIGRRRIIAFSTKFGE